MGDSLYFLPVTFFLPSFRFLRKSSRYLSLGKKSEKGGGNRQTVSERRDDGEGGQCAGKE